MVTQIEIARLAGVDVSSVNKILHGKPGLDLSHRTITNVWRVAHLLGYDFERLRRDSGRRRLHRRASIHARIFLYREDGSFHDQGTASLFALSVDGAILRNISCDSLPVGQVNAILRPSEECLAGIEIPCYFTLFPTRRESGYKVEFGRLTRKLRRKLKQFLYPQGSARAPKT